MDGSMSQTAGLEQYLFGFEASQYVWNMLWKRDQPVFTEMNILDVILLDSSGISGWLFTAADGAVRSKLQSRWNSNAIIERANGDLKREIFADFYDASAQKYIILNNKHVLKELVHAPHSNPSAIIVHANLKGTIASYMEINYEYPITIVKSNPPKITSYNLCESKSRGRVVNESESSSSLVPTDRIVCLSKDINSYTKNYIQALVKKIEKKHKVQVTKLNVVVMLETVPAAELAHIHPNNRDNVADKRVWLHHCTEVTTVVKSKRQVAPLYSDNSNSELGTIQSTTDLSTSVASTSSRTTKLGLSCIGDFCYYDSIESRKSGFDFMEDDEEFNVKEESLKAIGRHRKLNKDEQQEIDPDSDVEEVDDRFDKTFEEKPIASTNAGVNANQNALKAAHTKNVTAAAVVPVKQMKVTLKSIILARDEMNEIERLEQSMINAEMAKVVRGNRKGAATSVASVDSATVVESGGNHWPKTLQTWWLQVGRSLTKNKGGVVSIPLSSGHKIDQARLGVLNNSNNAVGGSSSVVNGGESSLSDLNETNMDQYIDAIVKSDSEVLASPSVKDQKNNLGHLSWYYSNVRVCEHCYLVYRELDRKRKLKYKKLLKSQIIEQEKNEDQRGKDIERRIFQQRQFVSRLATIDPQKIAAEQNLHAHQQQQQQQQNSRKGQQFGIVGGDSIAFDSVLTGDSYFDKAAALHYEKQLQARKAAKQLVGAPKGALPPLPWQLNSSTQRELYDKTSNTFAVRNVLDMKLDKHTSFNQNDTEIEDVWNEVTGIAALDHSIEVRRKAKKNALLSKNNRGHVGGGGSQKQFNADRLMHPWQRDLQKLRKLQSKNSAMLSGSNGIGEEGFEDEEQEEEYDEEQLQQQSHHKQFKSGVQRQQASSTMKGSQSHKAIIPEKSPTRRMNSLPSLHHNNSNRRSIDDLAENSLISAITAGSTFGSVLGGAGGGNNLLQASIGSNFSQDDNDYLSNKIFHSPKESKSMSSAVAAASSSNKSVHNKPPLKPIIQLTTVPQPSETIGGGNKHFNHLKAMSQSTATTNATTATAGSVKDPLIQLKPVGPALIAATIVNRDSSDTHSNSSVHSSGGVNDANGWQKGFESPIRSSLASSEGSRPSTSQQSVSRPSTSQQGAKISGASPGRPLHKAPLASLDIPPATTNNNNNSNSNSNNNMKAMLKPMSGGGGVSGNGSPMNYNSQLSRSSSSRMLTRSDSIAEMDRESDDDDDDNDKHVNTRHHKPSNTQRAIAATVATGGSPTKSSAASGSPRKSSYHTVKMNSTSKPSTAASVLSTNDNSYNSYDSDGDSDEDDDNDAAVIGYSPFVISFNV